MRKRGSRHLLGREAREAREGREGREEAEDLVTNAEEQLEHTLRKERTERSSLRCPPANNSSHSPQLAEEDPQIQDAISLQTSDADRLSTHISQLLAKNKINAKNAFEIPLIHLQQIQDYSTMTNDNSWRKISSSLENNNKIYGYRVDAFSNYTYRVLEQVARQDQPENERIGSGSGSGGRRVGRNSRYEHGSLNTQFFAENQDELYVRFIERNPGNLDIAQLETFFNVNPILLKTKRILDQQGPKGLLLDNIGIDRTLALRINLEKAMGEGKGLENKKTKGKDQNKQSQDNYKEYHEGMSENTQLKGSLFKQITSIVHINRSLQDEDNQSQVKLQNEGNNQLEALWMEFEYLSVGEVAKDKDNQDGQQEVSLPSPLDCITGEEPDNIVIDSGQQEKPAETEQMPITNEVENNEVYTGNQQGQGQPQQTSHPLACQQKEAALSKQDQQMQVNSEQAEHPQSSQSASLKQSSSHPSSSLPSSSQPHPPIISVITFKSIKLNNSNDFVLRELAIAEDHPTIQTPIEQWKNDSKQKSLLPRKPRLLRDPLLDHIDFDHPIHFLKKDQISIKRDVLSIDKHLKKQEKIFLKNVESYYQQYKQDSHVFFDTSHWRQNNGIVSVLRESLQLESKLVANASENEGNNEDQNFALNESQNLSERAEGYPNSIEYINLDASIEELEQTTSGGRTVAIRNIKEKVQRYIFELKLDSFIGIYNRFVQEEGSLSPALCFLTLLHLSNQHGMELVQVDDSDFTLKRGDSQN